MKEDPKIENPSAAIKWAVEKAHDAAEEKKRKAQARQASAVHRVGKKTRKEAR